MNVQRHPLTRAPGPGSAARAFERRAEVAGCCNRMLLRCWTQAHRLGGLAASSEEARLTMGSLRRVVAVMAMAMALIGSAQPAHRARFLSVLA